MLIPCIKRANHAHLYKFNATNRVEFIQTRLTVPVASITFVLYSFSTDKRAKKQRTNALKPSECRVPG